MDILKTLGTKPVRTEPLVWVRRFAILRNTDPTTEFIRDVPLERGVNIVWAREDEADDDKAPITGHSAGKTTFCRLIRYCLGEKTYGTNASMKAITEAFTDGYVAAELRVALKDWAVLRPIGTRTYSYVLEGGTVEDLLRNKGRRVTVDKYTEVLGIEGLMDDMDGPNLAATGDPVEWEHILAWCTRDQEARFKNLHEWRAVRSESETAGFRFKKAGPMLVMRMALGLYERDEIVGEERLSTLQAEKDANAKKLEEAEREPQILLRHHTEMLRNVVRLEFPDTFELENRMLRTDELQKCLARLAADAERTIQQRLDQSEADSEGKKSEIQAISVEEGKANAKAEPLLAEVELLKAGDKAENADAAELRVIRDLLVVEGNRMCRHARIIISECSEITKRMEALKGGAIRTAHELEMAEARRAQRMESVQSELAPLNAKIEACQARRKVLEAELVGLTKKCETDRSSLADLRKTLSIALALEDSISAGNATAKVAELRTSLMKQEAEHKALIEDLNLKLHRHNENRTLLERIFSAAVQSVLPATTYNGFVRFENRTLQFGVSRGAAMGGEAVETLSILLADVSCMIYNALNDKSCLPGFLMHDSPREADLGLRIYRYFIRFVVEQQQHFQNRDQCPFQYIITTTTPPPDELQEGNTFVKLRLNAAIEKELLFQQNVAVVSSQQQPELL